MAVRLTIMNTLKKPKLLRITMYTLVHSILLQMMREIFIAAVTS